MHLNESEGVFRIQNTFWRDGWEFQFSTTKRAGLGTKGPVMLAHPEM